ncbi:MAG TPA: FmdB family zinc ribbon protein [Blastocatellia bacterium]
MANLVIENRLWPCVSRIMTASSRFTWILPNLERLQTACYAWLFEICVAAGGGLRVMPIYEYVCEKCGERIEVLQKVTDRPLKRCRKCRGKLEKVVSRTSFQLKGGGWYKTDYSSSPASKTGEKSGEKSGDKAGEKSEKSEKSDKKKSDTSTASSGSGASAKTD